MEEEGFENFLLSNKQRNKVLSDYEDFVKEKLSIFQDTSAAQIHDWLKEYHPELPKVSPRTVYNFVFYVRHKYNIPFVKISREYFPIEELPYGQQAQVDFGQYNMRMANGQRKKVKFFVMVLARSRMKYICFWDKPYTAQTVCQAHEKAFAFFRGIPDTIVYDQDRVMVVDENAGDMILTSYFKQYTKSRNYNLHFCRKADPESKGKVENVVQYVKKNFLYNRLYSDIETLNTEAIAWLGRTGNYLPHNFTKKAPMDEFIIEQKHLHPYTPLTIENKENKMYHVRKTNTIAFKSNFYTLPMGTYKGSGTQVIVKENNNLVEIYNLDNQLICTHQLSSSTGQTIANTNHKRDNSKSLEQMTILTTEYFSNQKTASEYILKIKTKLPRYLRDHLQIMLKALDNVEKNHADQALDFCLKNNIFNGFEFQQVLEVIMGQTQYPKLKPIKLLDINNLEKANQTPQISNIQDYENLINQ
jgi:hypothetical protein